SVEKDSSSSASETQSSSTASSSLAATVTDSSNVTSASTLTSTQTTSSVGSQLRSASLMRIATNSSAQSSAVTKASQIDQTLELKYTGSINSGEVIKFAVWSDEKGQDDIVWYNADQTGAAYADLRKHRDYGKYNIHTYVNRNGKMVYLNEIVVDVKASGTITISNVDSQTGSFDVTISNITAPRGLTKVYVPTWTEAGGQDDIVWHEAERQSDGTYLAKITKSKHKNHTGKYISHVYYRMLDGSMIAVGGTQVELPSARSYTIYIDPGHGGVDSGASYGGVYEKNLALSVANKLKANLIQLGYQVLMTRTADYNVDFKTERSKMANQSNADLFISIHFNATGLASSNTTGIETYWYQYDPEYQPKINAAMHNDPTRLAESEILANQVHTSLISETGAVNRGVRRDTFAVLRETAIPAILVELGFMSNPSDLQKIKEDAYQTKLANALAQGIDNWYGAVGSKPTSGTSIQKKSTQ
ncbi:MAG: N-acetylmuramoyl-L-alanine amidase, partial [Streptococcus sp.]|nr:N-acetylmuramoyl-L-alanine amidase [Streptococcus sp.]